MTQIKTRIFFYKIPYFKRSFQISKNTDEQKYILTVLKNDVGKMKSLLTYSSNPTQFSKNNAQVKLQYTYRTK